MILYRAFVRETLQAGGVVGAVLLAVFLAARVVGFLRQVVEGDIPAASVLILLALKTITYLDLLAPLALYLAALLVMGRWIRDHELTVSAACGIGIGRFLRPAATLFAVVGAITALFSLYLSPLAAEASRSILHELRSRADLAAATPGVFTEGRAGDSVYFIERVDRDTGDFRNLFVYHGGDSKVDGVVVADSGQIVADQAGDFLVLKNGARYRAAAGDAEYANMDFAAYGLRIKAPPGDYRLPVEALPTAALLAALLEPGRAANPAAIGEFHWRLAKVAMLPALLIFALALSSIARRKARFPGLLAALLIYFAYSNALAVALAMLRRGAVDPHLALWCVHFIFLAAALILLRRRHLDKPLLGFTR